MLDRRALLVLAGATVPHTLRAQTTPAPTMPPMPKPLLPPHPTAAPLVAPMHPVVLPPAPPLAEGAIDKTKRYIVFFEQTIDVRTSRLLRLELTRLVEGGVKQITLVIHSPGGLLDSTMGLYSFVRALPAQVNTHGIGFVMSAACVLFLAGDRRTADRTARFMFHPSSAPMSGSFTSLQIEERSALFGEVAGIEKQIYRERTSITDADMARFNAGPVYYTADEAQKIGIVQSVADLSIPGPDVARTVFVE